MYKPDERKNFFQILGGMHTLMSLVGCIRTLVANTGLSDLLKSAFRSVEKMLSGNKLQKNIRALSIMFKKNTTVSPAG